ncbi:hypothetical protein RQP46_005500 [Phenoliferia psychrophenolica]
MRLTNHRQLLEATFTQTLSEANASIITAFRLGQGITADVALARWCASQDLCAELRRQIEHVAHREASAREVYWRRATNLSYQKIQYNFAVMHRQQQLGLGAPVAFGQLRINVAAAPNGAPRQQ